MTNWEIVKTFASVGLIALSLVALVLTGHPW